MTLIACVSPDSNPVFIADALLSSEGGRETAYLPTTGAKHKTLRVSKYRVHGMTRKLVKIGDFMLVAWAGDAGAAKRVLGKLAQFFSQFRPTLFNVQAVIGAADRADLNHLDLMIGVSEVDRICSSRFSM